MAGYPPEEFPLNASSAKGQSSSLGYARIRAAGSGLVATVYGIAGVQATLSTVTGTYNIKFQPETEVDLRPHFHMNHSSLASGINFVNVGMGAFEPGSGTAKLYCYQQVHQGGSGFSSSSYNLPVNLPTGAEVSLGIFRAPVTPY